MRVLRVFPDAGHPWPLWETGSAKYAMEPTDYGLTDELTDALRRWYDEWAHHTDDGSWQSSVQGRRWVRTGRSLSRRLEQKVSPAITVSYEVEQPSS